MFENNFSERHELVQEFESPQSAPVSSEPGIRPNKPDIVARVPSPRQSPAAKQPAPQPQAVATERRLGFLYRRPVVSAVGAVLLASVMAGGYLYLDYARHFVSTDDAFIAARQSTLAPKVAGYITAVPVTDNEHIVAGQVVARLDDRDYRVALAQAKAQVAAAQASIENVDAQLDVQQAQIAANQAQVDQAQAALVFAQQQAALLSAQATLNLAQRQVEALKAQRKSAAASLAQAQAQRDQAELNLSYTIVTAAQPGRVVNLSAAVGQFAQPGTNLTMFVPDETWVTANYKEIQLNQMRPKQAVTLKIDAYPGRIIRGHVESVQPGSGTAFSLLPAQNATGNYVKIVQRVPVKIVMDNPPTDVALGPGMSVVPTVRINPSPSLAERLGRLL